MFCHQLVGHCLKLHHINNYFMARKPVAIYTSPMVLLLEVDIDV